MIRNKKSETFTEDTCCNCRFIETTIEHRKKKQQPFVFFLQPENEKAFLQAFSFIDHQSAYLGGQWNYF